MIETKFKDTEVGRIPEDWELDKLKDKFEFRSNNTFSRDALSESGIIQDVHYGDVLIKYGSHLDVQKDEVPYITDKNYKASVYISDGDVIVADTAEDETVGKATEVINVGHHQLVSGLHTMWLHPIVQERYALGYLGYAFNANVYHNQLLPLMQGTKVTSVSKTAVKDTSILVPPKSEQTRIAKALSNIDTLISELGNLIEKKRAIKQGAIQQLLSGKKRLKGFSEPWVESTLGENILFLRTGLNPRVHFKLNTPDADCFYITVRELQGFDIITDEQTDKINHSAVERIDERSKLKIGDILFSGTGTIGQTALVKEIPKNWGIKEGIYAITPNCKTLNSTFLIYYLHTTKAISLFSSMSSGSTVNSVPMAKLIELTIPLPSLSEQSAIASVLTSMDNEISALEAKKAKYEQIKQGMMQQLLMGKIRLID